MAKTAFIVLQNGQVFKGRSFGYLPDCASVIGEIVFTTSMTGYLETLTDPSYYGQIVVQTFPLIGNYGVIPSDFESEGLFLKAYIVREYCEVPSNFRAEGTLSDLLCKNKIPGIYDIDTRSLTKAVREHGTMNAKIVYAEEEAVADDELLNHKIIDVVKKVSPKKINEIKNENSKYKIALLNFGSKKSIERELLLRDCDIINFPSNSTAEEILSYEPDGIMLSNGPGDPSENIEIIEELKKLNEKKIPTFAICLGHQLLALSKGALREKLKYGHRGGNQPVLDTSSKKTYVTSQNHGYAIVSSSLPKTAKLSFVNVNDGSCEGIEYGDIPAFSVQFHPEACGGPLDTNFMFDKFIDLIKSYKKGQ